MYGGAVFDLEGRHFDIHYRNLDVVEHWTREAEAGRFEVHILGFHLAGIPTYMLIGELASNRVLWGELARPGYPDALRRRAPAQWLQRAAGELSYARYWADTSNPMNCAGGLARAVMQIAHARLAHQGVWALNEKRMAARSGLDALAPVFASLGSDPPELHRAVDAVQQVREAVVRETEG